MHLDAFWFPVVEECSVVKLEVRLQVLHDYSYASVQHQRREKLQKKTGPLSLFHQINSMTVHLNNPPPSCLALASFHHRHGAER